MFLTGIGTAVPPGRFTQKECWEEFHNAPQFAELGSRARAILKKVLNGENGILTRHLAIDGWDTAFVTGPDKLHERFALHAPNLATQAARKALTSAQLVAHDIDAVIISTCTGYLCPGLTSYVIEQLGLRADVHALDLVGQGCGAAMPNLRTAESLLAGGNFQHVLSICVEVCSAAFYLDNDPGVLISACLFADGAGAAVLSQKPCSHGRRVEWKSAHSLHSPADRDLLRFEQKDGMLRNILTRDVPALAAKHAGEMFDTMLKSANLARSDITGWIVHAGGREVLAALKERLELSDDELRRSIDTLRDYGNVSSPFVFFVLEQALADSTPGGWWWMSSFGAGFSCYGAFLKVD